MLNKTIILYSILIAIVILLSGRTRIRTKDYSDRQTFWKKLIKIQPAPRAYNNLAKIYKLNGDKEKYFKYIKTSYSLDKTYFPVIESLIKYFTTEKEYDSAVYYINEYQKYVSIPTPLIFCRFGDIYSITGDNAKAEEYYDMAAKMFTKDKIPYIYLSRLYFEIGSDKKELTLLQRALKDNPEDAEIHFNLGDIYFFSYKDEKNALRHYSLAIRYNKDFIPAYYAKGNLLLVMGKNTESKKMFEYIINNSDDEYFIKKSKQRLRRMY